jgi:hypothetical protein
VFHAPPAPGVFAIAAAKALRRRAGERYRCPRGRHCARQCAHQRRGGLYDNIRQPASAPRVASAFRGPRQPRARAAHGAGDAGPACCASRPCGDLGAARDIAGASHTAAHAAWCSRTAFRSRAEDAGSCARQGPQVATRPGIPACHAWESIAAAPAP